MDKREAEEEMNRLLDLLEVAEECIRRRFNERANKGVWAKAVHELPPLELVKLCLMAHPPKPDFRQCANDFLNAMKGGVAE